MEEALLDRLLANAGVSALIQDRGNWLERPARDVLPGLTLRMIAANRRYSQDGADELAGSRVRFDCWGRSYGEAKILSRAVRAAVEPAEDQSGISFKQAFQVGERDLGPDDIPGGGKAFRVSMDFIVWWKPAA